MNLLENTNQIQRSNYNNFGIMEKNKKNLYEKINNNNQNYYMRARFNAKEFYFTQKERFQLEKIWDYMLMRGFKTFNRELLQNQQLILFQIKRIMEQEKLIAMNKKDCLFGYQVEQERSR